MGMCDAHAYTIDVIRVWLKSAALLEKTRLSIQPRYQG